MSLQEQARALRAGGASYNVIAETLGISRSSAYRWTNPEANATHLEKARQWKAGNRDKTRAYDADYYAAKMADRKYGECACGNPLSNHNESGTCDECIRRATAEMWTQAVAMWLNGATLAEVAEFTESPSQRAVGRVFVYLRAAGYQVPRRLPRGTGWMDPLPTNPIVIEPGWATAYESRDRSAA